MIHLGVVKSISGQTIKLSTLKWGSTNHFCPRSQIQPATFFFFIASELRMVFMYLNSWEKNKNKNNILYVWKFYGFKIFMSIVFLEHSHGIYGLSMVAFVLQTTRSHGPQHPKYLSSSPLKKSLPTAALKKNCLFLRIYRQSESALLV